MVKLIDLPVMKNLGIWFHLGFWIVYTILFTIIEASFYGDFVEALTFELTILPMRLLVVYFNYFVLLPRFLLQDKIIHYFSFTLLTLIIGGFFQRIITYFSKKFFYGAIQSFGDCVRELGAIAVDSGIWVPYKFLEASVVLASPLIILIGITAVWKIAELQKETRNLQNEKLQSELKYLKSQINPHFLFNTLNNIYGLALENSKKTPELILKLSDFLSFSIYESNQKYIPLEREIALMNDFIALEKDRFEDRVDVSISIPENLHQISIPPLILVPFVENAFKHSLKNETELAKIDIHLEVAPHELRFTVLNSKPEDVTDDRQHKGFGLLNIKKRLDLIYKDKFNLDIQNKTDSFRVFFKIDFS